MDVTPPFKVITCYKSVCFSVLYSPDLTWRDMQYVAMLSARTEPLYDGDWVINGVGRKGKWFWKAKNFLVEYE